MSAVIGNEGREAGSPDLKGMRILLVEDSWQMSMGRLPQQRMPKT
jgi:hypothetical protein